MLYPSGTSELATTRLVTTNANSITFGFHSWISFCGSFQVFQVIGIYAFARLGYQFGVDRRVIDGYVVDIDGESRWLISFLSVSMDKGKIIVTFLPIV